MAEALGVVASDISIVQLAGQIATSIAKFRGYWAQVKQAPSDIENLMGQIDSLSLLITQIHGDRGALGWDLDHSYMRHYLNRCEESSKELQLLVNDLERLLEREGKWKRKVRALKVVFKKKMI
jgi:DNA anti-recombination protein RmuC